MTTPTTTTGIQSGAANELLQHLFKKADTNGDGHVSANEFQSFLTMAMQTPSEKSAFLALAKNVTPTADNLRQIAGELGPEIGQISADGTSFALANGAGTVNIRDLGKGPVWQFTPSFGSR
jgi:Ca2+-binding EF-hand superfamily protein